MSQQLKILFLGLGSIGQRHLRNVNAYFQTRQAEVRLFAFRTSETNNVIENGVIQPVDDLSAYYNFETITDFSKAIELKPDVVFVCNPSSMHMKTAMAFASIGADLFIEKPMAVDMENVAPLLELMRQKALISMVGFQSRFHPCVEKVKQLMRENNPGRPISASFNWSTFLPAHHPYEDYRTGYAARDDLGGGVVNCLSHELDLIYHFYGMPDSVYAIGGPLSDLGIFPEDTVSALFKFRNDGKVFPVQLHLTFVQGMEQRNFELLFENAVVICDLVNALVKAVDHSGKTILEQSFPHLDRNELFMNELDDFFSSVKKRKHTRIPGSEGVASVKMASAIKRSITTEKIQPIEGI